MAVRSIVCLHNGFQHEMSGLATACELARDWGGHLRIVHAGLVTRPYSGFFGEAAVVGSGWQEAIDRQRQEQLTAARKAAAEACEAAGLPFVERPTAELPRAEFVPVQNAFNRTLVRDLSLSDLIVMGAKEGSGAVVDKSVADLALFSTGRPMLLVRPRPGGAAAPVTAGPCVIALNESIEAVRAIVHGRPLYQNAGEVHVLVAKDRPDGETGDHERLALDYLAAHGIAARRSVIDPQGRQDAVAVLERAREIGCSMLVMGAFGHSVFREMLLGGFSEYMLEQAEMPLLLCH